MKKLLIAIFLLFTGFIATAQQNEFKTGNFTIETVEYGGYINNNWEMDGPPVPYSSLFKVSKHQVKQINANQSWVYYIEKEPVWNEEFSHWVSLIIDSEGEEYLFIVDLNNRNLRFIYKDGNDAFRITRFSFSNVFVK